MPDNGVMMVNPRDITVVFSPEITVQGRPLNASVVFEKFTHRMIPTRMRIQLTMRVIYWGPQREMTTYTAEQGVATSRVSWAATTDSTYTFTYGDLESNATGDRINEIIDTQLGFINTANAGGGGGGGGGGSGGTGALGYAVTQWNAKQTKYSKEKRDQLWDFADCSSLVWGGFQGVGQAATLGWSTTQRPQYVRHAHRVHLEHLGAEDMGLRRRHRQDCRVPRSTLPGTSSTGWGRALVTTTSPSSLRSPPITSRCSTP